MDSYGEILRLCRLCLVKDQVSIPIFDDPGDLRQIFFKISSCLPVKISQEDRLPKKICDGCLNKLDIVYEFWNSTANAEKTLLSRLAALDEEKAEEPPVPKPIQETVVKEEFELVEETKPNVALEESHHDETECPPSKRARTQINTELEEDDLDTAEVITKVEEEIDNEEVSFADMPSTSADDAQPGPSGLGKDGEEAPFNKCNFFSPRLIKDCINMTENLRDNVSFLGHSLDGGLKLLDQQTQGRKQFISIDHFTTDTDLQGHEARQEESISGNLEESNIVKEEKLVDFSLVCVTCDIPHCDPEHLHQEGCSYFCETCCEPIDSKRNMISHAINHSMGNASQLSYACTKCLEEFDDLKLLEYHRVTCDSSVTDRSKLKETVKTESMAQKTSSPIDTSLYSSLTIHTTEKPYTCDVCQKCFSHVRHLNKHLKTHTADKPHVCNVCQKCFAEPYLLKRHLRIHTAEKLHRCNECGKRFSQLRYLTEHSRIHTRENLYSCNECGKCFTQVRNLTEHIRTHTGEKPYICNVCGKCFTQVGNLTEHLRIHTGERRHSCNECGKCFTHVGNLTKHLKIHTGEKPHSCNVCGKCFNQAGHLTKHMLIHTGEKLHSCNICGKCFSRLEHLNRHLRTHTGDKPYMCEVCQKCFSERFTLNKHSRVHTTPKSYSCKKCGKWFTRQSSLATHLEYHSEDRPYVCDICRKRFLKRAHLNNHLRIHIQEKPFTCNLCGKCFAEGSSLTKHLRIHTEKEKYECDYCGLICPQRSTVIKHLKNAHSEDKTYHCKNCKIVFETAQERDSHCLNNCQR